MKEFVLITTPDCVKCKFIKSSVEQRCKDNDYEFKETEYTEDMSDITSVPCAKVWDKTLDYEQILQLITN